jgi:hypothetical protein
MFNGVNDGSMTYLETMATYAAVTRRFPNATTWLRTFAVPGLLHCRGGIGPTGLDERLLDALVAWMEQGQAPETVVANRFSQDNGLEFAKAANWSCRVPNPRP